MSVRWEIQPIGRAAFHVVFELKTPVYLKTRVGAASSKVVISTPW